MDKAVILNKMRHLCSRRECPPSEIRRKIERCGREGEAVGEELIQEILASLTEEGYLDEARYASAFVRERSALTGWGAAKIAAALRSRGISEEAVREALEEAGGEDAERRLETLLRNKWQSLRNEGDGNLRRAKLFRYALGRGYSYDQILKHYDNIRTT